LARKKRLPSSITHKAAGPRAPERWVFRARAGTDPATGRDRYAVCTFYNEREAVAYDARHTSKQAKGALSGRSVRFTVEQAVNEWLEMQMLDPGTEAGYRELLQPIVDAHGSLPVRKLHKTQLAKVAQQLFAGTFPYKTPAGRKRKAWNADRINKMLGRAEKVLGSLRDEGYLDTNMAALVPRFRPQRTTTTPQREAYTAEEVGTIMAAASTRTLNLFVVVMLSFLGLRRGEISGLEWGRIDLKKGRMWVIEQRKPNRRRKSLRAEGEPAALVSAVKSETSKRELPLPPSAVVVLKLVRRWQQEMHLASGKRWGVDGGLPTTVVVDEVTGRPIAPAYPWKLWSELVETLAIIYLSLHHGRDTAGSLVALQPGIGPHHVGAWLGHAPKGSIASAVTGIYLVDIDEQLRQAFCAAWETVFGPIVTKCDTLGAYGRSSALLSA
jgi:integrase